MSNLAGAGTNNESSDYSRPPPPSNPPPLSTQSQQPYPYHYGQPVGTGGGVDGRYAAPPLFEPTSQHDQQEHQRYQQPQVQQHNSPPPPPTAPPYPTSWRPSAPPGSSV